MESFSTCEKHIFLGAHVGRQSECKNELVRVADWS